MKHGKMGTEALLEHLEGLLVASALTNDIKRKEQLIDQIKRLMRKNGKKE
ncbi:hypothetical protein [Paenibacillus sp. Y412MC10]|nr:hypothetical protein [Paenibacillus sp. Y412MC10]